MNLEFNRRYSNYAGMDGFKVCKMLKKGGFQSSIIMLTAKDEVEDRVKGLTIGADDYVVKPFSFEELLARIQARLLFPIRMLSFL